MLRYLCLCYKTIIERTELFWISVRDLDHKVAPIKWAYMTSSELHFTLNDRYININDTAIHTSLNTYLICRLLIIISYPIQEKENSIDYNDIALV